MVLLATLLVVFSIQTRSQMRANLVKARLIRHEKSLRKNFATRKAILEKQGSYAVKANGSADSERVKTEQMEILVRRLRRHHLDILSFQAERKSGDSGIVIELNLSIAGEFPDVVGALDEIGIRRPAWLARQYRIRLTGQNRVQMDGVFHLLIDGNS